MIKTSFNLLTLLFLIAILISSSAAYSQTAKIDSLKQLIDNRPDDTLKVQLMFELGEEYMLKYDTVNLYNLNGQIMEVAKDNDLEIGKAVYNYFLSRLNMEKGKYNKGLELLVQAANLTPKNQKFAIKIMGHIKLYEGNIHFRLNELTKASRSVKESIESFWKIKDRIGEARCHRALGLIAQTQGDSNLALKSLKESLKHFKAPKDNIRLVTTYNSIGITLMELGAYNEALDYHKKSLQFRIDNALNSEGTNVSTAHNNMGLTHKYLGNFDESIYHLEKAIETSIDPINYFGALSNMSQVYFLQNNVEKAININSDILLSLNPDSAPNQYIIDLKNKSLFLAKINEYDSAIVSLNIALKFLDQSDRLKEKSLNYYIVYRALSEIYFSKKEYRSALRFAETGLRLFEGNSFLSVEYIVMMVRKIEILYQIYSSSKDEQQSKDVIKEIDRFHSLLTMQRNFYQKFEDKLELSKEAFNIYFLGNKVCQNLLKATNDTHYLDIALGFTEKSKALHLKESLLDYRAKKFSGIPDSLQEKEHELKVNISYYQSRISELKDNDGYDSAYVSDLENDLFDANREYEQLLQKLEGEYPKYHNLKYKEYIVGVEEIQQQLKSDQAVVEYLMGDSTLQVFTITKNHMELQSIPFDSALIENISTLQKEFQEGAIRTPQGLDPKVFNKSSYEVYNTILEPVMGKLPNEGIDKLVIIPDDKLWQVNFDLLLTEASQSNTFKDLPYLIKNYSISYGYSATLLFGEQYREEKELIQECLAFSFTDSTNLSHGGDMSLRTLRGTEVDLPGSREEVRAISDVLDGTYYYGASANENNFKEKAKDYAILHLALHGEVDDREPMNSKLFFTPSQDSVEDNKLYAYELYNMSLNAELAVLSACNTGKGQLASGEGIMSLGRAFSYAGVKSMLVSYWDVSDKASPEIMATFYKGLKKGLPKDEALRQAKLQYLENSDIYTSNPFYWGGFALLGDSSAMEFEEGYNWWVISFVVMLTVVFGLILAKQYGKYKSLRSE